MYRDVYGLHLIMCVFSLFEAYGENIAGILSQNQKRLCPTIDSVGMGVQCADLMCTVEMKSNCAYGIRQKKFPKHAFFRLIIDEDW